MVKYTNSHKLVIDNLLIMFVIDAETTTKLFNEVSSDFAKIKDSVDRTNGIIFGSTMHKIISTKQNNCINYKTKDIDILFTSKVDLDNFVYRLSAIFPTSTLHNAEYHYPYSFTDYIYQNEEGSHKNKNGRMEYPSLKYYLWNNEENIYFEFDLSVLNISKFTESEQLSIKNRDELAVLILHKRVIKYEFLCNLYMNKQIFYMSSNVNITKLPNFTKDAKFEALVRKYSNRMVEITLTNGYDLVRPSNKQFSDAKNFYKSKGLVVIPLSRRDNDAAGKAPAVKNWSNLTNSYDFMINSNYINNIGITCGSASGIVCIDVDVKDNGVKFFNRMIKLYKLPDCPIQKSGSGGFHYIFKYNEAKMKNMPHKIKCPKYKKTPIGIDMWIQQCQFVASPSVNYSTGKSYKWIKHIGEVKNIPEMPEWLYDLYNFENIKYNGQIIKPNQQPIINVPQVVPIPTINVPQVGPIPTINVPEEASVPNLDTFDDSESSDSSYNIESDDETDDESINSSIKSSANHMETIMTLIKYPENLLLGFAFIITLLSTVGFIVLIVGILTIKYKKEIKDSITDYLKYIGNLD